MWGRSDQKVGWRQLPGEACLITATLRILTISDLFSYELKQACCLPRSLVDEPSPTPYPSVSQVEGSSDLIALYHDVHKRKKSIRASGLHAKGVKRDDLGLSVPSGAYTNAKCLSLARPG